MTIDDIFVNVTPLSVTAALMVGLGVGWMVVRGLDAESVFAQLVQVGTPLFLVVALTRWVEGGRWASWLGAEVLFLIFALGCVIGFWARRRTGRPLP